MDSADHHGSVDLDRLSRYPPSFRYLSDNGMREAIRRGALAITPLHDTSIQPASLDVRIRCARVYDANAHLRMEQAHGPGPLGPGSADTLAAHATRYPIVGGDQILIPPRAFAELFLEERIDYAQSFQAQATLRSSRGRLCLRLDSPRLLEDSPGSLPPGHRDETGPYLGVWNFNPNPIILHASTPFAQLFFMPQTATWDAYAGKTVTDPAKVREIASRLSPELETVGPYVLFRVGDRTWSYLEYGPIDTAGKTPPQAIRENKLTHIRLDPFEGSVVKLEPAIKVPTNIGIRLLHTLPYVQRPGPVRTNPATGESEMLPDTSILDLEPFVVNGEWVDPGYEGNVTAHPIPITSPRIIAEGDPLCVGLLIEYPSKVERAYGDATLGSHYQHSSGDVSRS